MEIIIVLCIIVCILLIVAYQSNHCSWRDIPHAPIGWNIDKEKNELIFMKRKIEFFILYLPNEIEFNKMYSGYATMKHKYDAAIHLLNEQNPELYRVYTMFNDINIWCNSSKKLEY